MRCDEGKTRYSTKEEAEETIAAWTAKWEKQGRRKRNPPNRSYLCPFCSFWHVTSQPLRRRA